MAEYQDRGRRSGRLGAFVAWLLVGASIGCAVPIAPSGGPPDDTPPSLLSSDPADGSTGVSTDRIVLRFDEYVEQRSAAGAVTVTPTTDRPPEIRYRGKEIELRFEEMLRDSTTWIVTLDTGFRDAHGVALKTPLVIAFSTGEEIDRGRITGQVLLSTTGRPATGVDILAYEAIGGVPPDSLPARPAYRTQTDSEGRFTLSWLAPRPFHVLALRDANGSRRPDPGEPMGLPPEHVLVADTAFAAPAVPWILHPRDDQRPVLRRVDALSRDRLKAVFSESVRLTADSPGAWMLVDSLTGVRRAVHQAWRAADDPRSVYLRTADLEPTAWRLSAPAAIADSTGNVADSTGVLFAGSAHPDTLRTTFVGFTGDSLSAGPDGTLVIAPWASAGLRFSEPLDPESIRSRIAVRDTAGAALPFSLSDTDPPVYGVTPDGRTPGLPFVIEVLANEAVGADSTRTKRFALSAADQLGELSGTVVASDTTGASIVVELLPVDARPEPPRRSRALADGSFRFSRLPAGGRYRLRAFVDRNRDDRWSPGSRSPWDPAEHIGWFDSVPAVRARWDTVIPDTLRIGPTRSAETIEPPGPEPGQNRNP